MMEEEYSPSEDEVIRLAFELEGKPATEILLQLGKLDLWRGDLSVMRGDVPRAESESAPPIRDDAESRAEALHTSIFMKEALRHLTTHCRDILRSRYVEHRDLAAIAAEFGTTPGYVDKLLFNCRARAYAAILEDMTEPHEPQRAGESQEPDILPGKTRRAR